MTGEAGGEGVRPQETQGREGEVSAKELTLGTFNVRKPAIHGVNGLGHVDNLLIICTAKSCDVLRLQETKRDETSEISASGYRVFFSDDCSMVKGRKGQHGVGRVIKEEIVKRLARTISQSSASAHVS